MVRRISGGIRRLLAAALLPALLLFLQAAVALPALHHAMHGEDDPHAPAHECDEPGCVVVALASGAMDLAAGVDVLPAAIRHEVLIEAGLPSFARSDCPLLPGRSPPS